METYQIDNETMTANEVQKLAYEYLDLNNEREIYLGKGENEFIIYLQILADYGHKVILCEYTPERTERQWEQGI